MGQLILIFIQQSFSIHPETIMVTSLYPRVSTGTYAVRAERASNADSAPNTFTMYVAYLDQRGREVPVAMLEETYTTTVQQIKDRLRARLNLPASCKFGLRSSDYRNHDGSLGTRILRGLSSIHLWIVPYGERTPANQGRSRS